MPVVCCANTDAQASSTRTAAPKDFLIIQRLQICGYHQCSTRNGDRYRSPSAIETPELTLFCAGLEPPDSSGIVRLCGRARRRVAMRDFEFVAKYHPDSWIADT